MNAIIQKLKEIKQLAVNYKGTINVNIHFERTGKGLLVTAEEVSAVQDQDYLYQDVRQLEEVAKPLPLVLYQTSNAIDEYGFQESADWIASFRMDKKQITKYFSLTKEEQELLNRLEIYVSGSVLISLSGLDVSIDFLCSDSRLNPYSEKTVVPQIQAFCALYNTIFDVFEKNEHITYTQAEKVSEDVYYNGLIEDRKNLKKYVKTFLQDSILLDEQYFIYLADRGDVFRHGVYHEGYNFNWNNYMRCNRDWNYTTIHQYVDKSWCMPGNISHTKDLTGLAYRTCKEQDDSALKQFIKYELLRDTDIRVDEMNISLTYSEGFVDTIKENNSDFFFLNRKGRVIGKLWFDGVGDTKAIHKQKEKIIKNMNNIINKLVGGLN